MGKIKKVYIDSRYKTSGSISNSAFTFELKESLDLPENTVCYIDDISIPRSWYTIENYSTLYLDIRTQIYHCQQVFYHYHQVTIMHQT